MTSAKNLYTQAEQLALRPNCSCATCHLPQVQTGLYCKERVNLQLFDKVNLLNDNKNSNEDVDKLALLYPIDPVDITWGSHR